MATVTPNFNWPVPTSTDLVKDGATAIEALGDSIDASLVDLKGGTTGQVLSKASNTDMDFTWVTDAAGDIQGVTVTSPLTGGGTSGTVTVGILNGTTSNLGAVQLSDSTSSTSTTLAATANAVKTAYDIAASPEAGKNGVLNSAFNVWQRGTSITYTPSTYQYTADRWQYDGGTGRTITRQTTSDTTNLPNIQYCIRVARDAGNTTTNNFNLNQCFESINSIPFAGRTVTFSFYARAGANYSATSNALGAQVITGTGTDQNFRSGSYTGQATALSTTATLTTSWQRFSVTGTIASTATELGILFFGSPTGTAGANDWFEVTGVQLEIAGSATAYSPNTSTYQAELEACERYFQLLTPTDAFQDILTGASCDQTAFCRYPFVFPTIMRRTPTCSNTGSAGDYGNLVAAGYAGASAAPSFANIRNTGVTIYVYSSSITTGQGTCLRNSTSFPSQWLTFSAEL
jgi:hypothetical protein